MLCSRPKILIGKHHPAIWGLTPTPLLKVRTAARRNRRWPGLESWTLVNTSQVLTVEEEGVLYVSRYSNLLAGSRLQISPPRPRRVRSALRDDERGFDVQQSS
ncbi:hypothetical protein OPT61_g7081 [Boeremia exigua]|uniref:Uncharacterized protein n=1 Tax=Boeremia exigua TaxID=749465 RepID=A0ACC2I3S8_9PLEO|nr:hypothetical protein OPT61_g7081 [Boeremia exigua]